MMLMENLSICVFESFQRWVKMVLMKNVTKSEYLNICSQKVSIVDEKCENLLFEWTVQIGKVMMSIFFEINVADEKSEHLSWRVSMFDEKSEHLCFYLVFKMAVPLSTQLPSSPCSFYTLVWNKVSSSWKFSLSIFRFYCLITKYSRAALLPRSGSGVNGVLRKLF